MKMQFHLSSAVIGLIAAGLLLGANMRPEGAALKGEAISWALYGWPFRAYEIEYHGYAMINVIDTQINWYPLFGNILVALLILFVVVLLSELWIYTRNSEIPRHVGAAPPSVPPPKKPDDPSP